MSNLTPLRRKRLRATAPRVSAALVCLLASSPLARAAEHITLRNGFAIDCIRHEPQGDKVRLYLASQGGTQENFTDVSAASILTVEIVPDPPNDPATRGATPALAPPFPATAGSSGELRPAEIAELLSRAGAAHHIDAELLASVVSAESGGHAHAVSRTGARGLMQLMPGTASALGVHDAFVPAQNVEGGTSYLDQLLTRFHDNIALALAAYNAGPAAVDRFHGVPPFRETQAYVARVIREFNRRKLTLLALSKATSASQPK